jgi:hypothetical protein
LFNNIITRELETSLAGKAARVAELEADRLEIETIRMKEMDMVIALRDEVENSKKQHAQVAGIFCLQTVLRICYPGSQFFPSRVPDPIKNLSIITPKMVSNLSEYDPGCSSRILILIFLPIPDPRSRGKKAPDPLSGSATLLADHITVRPARIAIRSNAFCVMWTLKVLKGEGTFLPEGGLYFISRQNGSKLCTHLLIDTNEAEVLPRSGVSKRSKMLK